VKGANEDVASGNSTEGQFLRCWVKLSKELHRRLEAELAPELTESQLNVLDVMLMKNGDWTTSELIEFLETTPAAVTMILDRMEKHGLIARTRDERDRRIVRIAVTTKGKTAWERGVRIREQIAASCLSRLSAHNQRLLVYLLSKAAGVPTTAESGPSPTAVTV